MTAQLTTAYLKDMNLGSRLLCGVAYSNTPDPRGPRHFLELASGIELTVDKESLLP